MKQLDKKDWMAAEWLEPSVPLVRRARVCDTHGFFDECAHVEWCASQAVEHRHDMVFAGGRASLCATGDYQLAAKLGDGISLYFRLLVSTSTHALRCSSCSQLPVTFCSHVNPPALVDVCVLVHVRPVAARHVLELWRPPCLRRRSRHPPLCVP